MAIAAARRSRRSAGAPAFATPREIPLRVNRARHGICQRRASAMSASRADFSVSVYLVTDRRTHGSLTVSQVVEAAVRDDGTGHRATIVQLRDKDVERSSSLALGRVLREVTKRHGVTFVVNDSVELAALLRADGVHLGQDDAGVAEAREVLGEGAIVGVSAGTVEEAERALADGADYVGVGAVFETRSKADAGEAIGPEGLREVVEAVAGTVPVVAIGGVAVQNAALCREAGADGVAVVSAIMQSARPGEVAAELSRIMGGVDGR